MKDNTIYFLTGMPRSGSTLLANVLGQNPKHHVTATNGLCQMLLLIRENWHINASFRAQGLYDVVEPRIRKMCQNMISGFYDKEFSDGKIVFDKDRTWISRVEMIESILQRPVKMICTMRDPRDAFASFEKLRAENGLSYQQVADENDLTQYGRADRMLSAKGVIGSWIHGFRNVRDTPTLADRLFITSFRHFTSNPEEVMSDLHNFLELPEYEYDFSNVEQAAREDDVHHGWKNLHLTRRKVESQPKNGWQKILSKQTADAISGQFQDLIDMVNQIDG